ncbi:MAG: hypothetical protein ACOX3U_01510 [Christensenellales bacterium]
MKKLTVIVIIALIVLSLSGCAESVESTFTSNWHKYEKYIYDVYENGKAGEKVGELVIISERLTNQDVKIGDKNYKSITGTYISYELQLDNSDDSVFAETFFNTNFQSVASYKHIKADKETIIIAEYKGGKYIYTMTTDGEKSGDEIKLKAPYYDNEIVYYILRSADLNIKNFSFTFNCPMPQINALQNRTAAIKPGEYKVNALGDDIDCHLVTMRVNGRITGKAYEIYYAKQSLNIDGEDVLNPLIKIVEGEYAYVISSLTLNKE